jgi:hypothetical protein
LIH